jgi:hypothetical protein
MNGLLAFWRRALLASRRAIFPWATRIAELEAERDGLKAQRDGLKAACASRVTEFEAERNGLKAAYATRVPALEAHVDALTEASIDRERKLQEKQDLGYQVLMTHQHFLAGLKDVEPRFHALYGRCKDYSMTSAERLCALYKSIEYIVAGDISGDVAECGVWRGGSCMLMSLALLELGSTALLHLSPSLSPGGVLIIDATVITRDSEKSLMSISPQWTGDRSSIASTIAAGLG